MSAMTTDPVLPAAGVTLTINCRTGDGRARRHTAELGPDWAFSTPHDLGLERIGVALGGSLTCVRLADHDLPAARDFLEHRHRVRPAAIVQHDALEWGAATAALKRTLAGDAAVVTPAEVERVVDEGNGGISR